MSWQENKKWSDAFIPEIKRALAGVLLCESPVEEDQERNTDLIVLRMEAKRVACRVRRLSYLHKFGDEFTIRATLPSGKKTELAKVIEGFGDYIFYGFAGDDGTLMKWSIGDLNVFRLWFNSRIVNDGGTLPGRLMVNGDKSSCFRVFRWDQLPPHFVVNSFATGQP